MLKMSFYNNTLDRKKASEIIEKTDKKIVYTYGFEFRHPTTHRVEITKEKALKIIKNEDYLDIKEEETCFHLNAFSSNDMW